jgi:beta,beta-carotene 9',10'-dioxygenase
MDRADDINTTALVDRLSPQMDRAHYALGFDTGQELPEPTNLAVIGQIPDWLSGTLLRTAPARFEVGKTALTHWFDGHAMLHRFAIADGKVSYCSRYLESDAAQEASEIGALARGEYGTDPERGVLSRLTSLVHAPKFTDNCNVNVVARGDLVLALTETPQRLAFDPATLQVEHHIDDAADIGGQIATAHPHYDRARSTIYSTLLDLGLKSTCKLVATDDQTGDHRLIAEFAIDHPSYLHSFGMSASYLIVALAPFGVDPLAMAMSGKPFIRNYRWRPELGLRFVVIDKQDGHIVVDAHAAPAFFFHHVNAFDEENDLIVDMIIYPDAEIVGRLDLDRLRSTEPTSVVGQLHRFRIDLTTGGVTSAALSDTALEFPQINYEANAGQPYRFVYGAGAFVADFNDCIVKLDLDTGSSITWHDDGLYPGEPVFVADPDGHQEDSGLILSVALDPDARCSWLIILDATTLTECARVRTPYPITFGFHGGFFPQAATASSGAEDMQ